MALYFGCQNLIFHSVISWMAQIFVERGASSTRAGFILGMFTLVFTLSSPVYGTFSKDLDRRHWLAFSGACTAIGLAALAFAPAVSPFITVACNALGLRGAFTLGITLPLDNTGHEDEAAACNACVLMIGYVIAALGPLSVGLLRDQMGDFATALSLLFSVALIMLELTRFLQPRRDRLTSAR